jgi:hypothetical protein
METPNEKNTARLNAAAPELLAALEAILARVDAPGGSLRTINWQSIAAARSAVAKASR